VKEVMSLDGKALELINIIDHLVNWGDSAFERIRLDKWKILAKRIMAASGSDLQEFIHNVTKDIAGDKVTMSEEIGRKIENLLKQTGTIEQQIELLKYVKRRAYPLVIRYMVTVKT